MADLDAIVEQSFSKGSPFTVDVRRMIRKTIESGGFSGGYQSSMVRLALMNHPTSVYITNSEKEFALEFDGPGLTLEQLTLTLKSIYLNSESKSGHKMAGLGRAILSALSEDPISVKFSTYDDSGSLSVALDKEYKPIIEKTDKKTELNRIIVRKKKGIYSDRSVSPLDFAMNVLHKLYTGHKRDIHKENENLINKFVYSAIPIAINGKKVNKGLMLKNCLFQKSYKSAATTFNFVIGEPKTQNQKLDDSYSSLILVANGEIAHKSLDAKLDFMPTVLIDNPNFKRNITGVFIKDELYHAVIREKDVLLQQFYSDFASEIPNFSINSRSSALDFLAACVRNTFCFAEAENWKPIENSKLFHDINGRNYSIRDIDQMIEESPHLLNFYYVSDKHKKHKSLKYRNGIILTGDRYQIALFNHIFTKIYPKKLGYGYAVTDLDHEISRIIKTAEEEYNKTVQELKNSISTKFYSALDCTANAFVVSGRAVKKPVKYLTIGTTVTGATGLLGYGAHSLAGNIDWVIAAEYGVEGLAIAGGSYMLYLGAVKSSRTVKRFVAAGKDAVETLGLIAYSHVSSYVETANSAIGKRIEEYANRRAAAKQLKNEKKQAAKFAAQQKRLAAESLVALIDAKTIKMVPKETKTVEIEPIVLSALEKEFIGCLAVKLHSQFHLSYPLAKQYGLSSTKIIELPDEDVFYSKRNGVSQTLYINTGSKDFAKVVECYRNNPGSIHDAIKEVEKKLNLGSLSFFGGWDRRRNPNAKYLAYEDISLAHREVLDDVVDSYQSERGHFKDKFDKLAVPEKRRIIRKIFEDKSSAGSTNRLDQWLLQNYEDLIQEVSEERASDGISARLDELINNGRTGEFAIEFESLDGKDKVRVLKSFLESRKLIITDTSSPALKYLDDKYKYLIVSADVSKLQHESAWSYLARSLESYGASNSWETKDKCLIDGLRYFFRSFEQYSDDMRMRNLPPSAINFNSHINKYYDSPIIATILDTLMFTEPRLTRDCFVIIGDAILHQSNKDE